MSTGGDSVSDRRERVFELPPQEMLQQLEPHERVLLEVKGKLYGGSWDQMLADLKARLQGKPYVFKLSRTIERDVSAIERMVAYEAAHNVDLSRLLDARERD